MRKKSTGMLCLILILSMLLGNLYQPIARADSVSPFTDIDESHWAFKSVIKLQCRGVISGYSNHAYKPNNVISQVEAAILAVRNLAVKSEVEAVDDSQPLPFEVPEWAANNNKKELLYALKIGLITPETFHASKAAARDWFTQLMVNMCGKGGEAEAYNKTATSFSDDEDIAQPFRGAVNLAVQKGIISGYSDNTFLPNKYVTRVEAASILDRCEPYLDLSDSVHVAAITNVMGHMLTLQGPKGTQNALLSSSTWGFDEKGRLLNVSNFKAGENIKYILGSTNIIYAERTTQAVAFIDNDKKPGPQTINPPSSGGAVINPYLPGGQVVTPPSGGSVVPEVPSSLSGRVLYVSERDSILVVRKSDGSLLTAYVTASTRITDNSGMPLSLSSIPTDGEVLLALAADGSVSSISLKSSTASGSVVKQGTIYRIVPNQKLFMLKTESGDLETYLYTSLLNVIIPGVNVSTISDLNLGDSVRVTLESGVMESVERIDPVSGEMLSGEIVLMPENSDLLIVNVGGEKEIYSLSNKTSVTVPGNTSASVRSLKVGDVIHFSTADGVIEKIEVQNRLVGSDLEGRVKAIDTRENILVLETPAGITYSYKIKPKVRILIDSEEASLNDIQVDDIVSLTLFNDEINTITITSGLTGLVTAVDADRMLMTIKDDSSSDEKTYAVEVAPDVTIEGVSRASISNVRAGDRVHVEMDDNVISGIEVERTIAYTVSGVKESASRIVVVEPAGSSRTLYVKSSVDVVVPDVAYPTIYDFEVGDQIDATFMGVALKKIEVIPFVTGQLVNVDPQKNTFTVRTYEGITKSFDFKKDAVIINDSTHGGKTENHNLDSLAVNDRVIVLSNTKGDMTVYRLDKIEGTFVSVLAATSQIRMIASPMIINRTYGLNNEVYLHQGSNNLGWNDFHVNDQITVYLHESQVYEVEKQ